MAQELGVPHTLASAVQVIKRALENSAEVERVGVLDTSHPDEVVIEVFAHLVDGQRFRVLVTVS